MLLPQSPKQNQILGGLPASEYARLFPHLTPVSMPLESRVLEAGGRLDHAYFPTTSIVSLFTLLENGATAEYAVVGNEGVLGMPLFMGHDRMPSEAVVQSAGNGYKLKADILKKELAQGGALLQLVLQYMYARMSQMAQTAVCNRHHRVEQQLCRWLLLTMDRVQGNQLKMTHERIAHNLGVRREGVTEAAGRLQADGLIKYSRGQITVLDRDKLEKRVCECYAADKSQFKCQQSKHGVPVPGQRTGASVVMC